MRLYDGLRRYQLYSLRDMNREPGDAIPAHELATALRHGPRDALDRVVDFLVSEFAWHPADFEHHDAAIERLIQLIHSDQVVAVGFRPSASTVGEVPDEDDVQALTDLVEDDEDDEVDAGVQVEAPMGIEPASEVAPPDGFEVGFEVADPDMPAFDFEVG